MKAQIATTCDEKVFKWFFFCTSCTDFPQKLSIDIFLVLQCSREIFVRLVSGNTIVTRCIRLK